MDEILTIEEAAEYLRVSHDTIRKMIKDKTLKAAKIRGQWRIRKADIDQKFEDQNDQEHRPRK